MRYLVYLITLLVSTSNDVICSWYFLVHCSGTGSGHWLYFECSSHGIVVCTLQLWIQVDQWRLVCVCVCVRANFPSGFPPTSYQPHQSTQLWLGTWHLLGCKFKAFSHETAIVQVGLRVPTPLAVRKGLFSCKFLARLQELCLHGSQFLLGAQASWLCQVHVTWQQENLHFLCMCVCEEGGSIRRKFERSFAKEV